MDHRARRLRINASMRQLVAETNLSASDLIQPIFIKAGIKSKEPIKSLIGIYYYAINDVVREVEALLKLGIKAIILFGIPLHKDAQATSAYDPNGIVQQAIKLIKKQCPEMLIMVDLCMCQYTDHGHCGIIDKDHLVNNDATIEVLAKIALSYAQAGANVIAPSDMMDGRVAKIRQTLDANHYYNVSILAYSAKYASNFYGPFRAVANSAPQYGDRKTYQMDYHNSNEAVKEVLQDINEAADMVMVKPAMAYLDIIAKIKPLINIPLVAYNVSGEYAMLQLAIKNNLVQPAIIYETLIAIKRAGADLIITYFAKQIAQEIQGQKNEDK